MKYLLDTHVILWLASDADKLSLTARDIISNTQNDVYISLVSLWEMQIKVLLGKFKLNLDVEKFWSDLFEEDQFKVVEIKVKHILSHAKLASIHKDTFDRMLISQANVEGMNLITRDQHIPKYDVKTIW